MANTRAEIVLFFGDAEYLFSLKVAQIEELERVCNASIFDIVQRVLSGHAFLCDIRGTIRLGLIGGGMPPVRAEQLQKLYVDAVPINRDNDPASPFRIAKAVLIALMIGIDELPQEEVTNTKKKPSIDEQGSMSSEQLSSSSTSLPTKLPE